MARKTEPTTTESRSATFDLNDPTLKAIMAQAVATALAAQRAELLQAMADQQASAPKVSMAGKTTQQVKNEIATVRAFKKLGITAKPHVDTFTFNKWVSKGFRPKEGSKSIKAGGLRLFHVSQVRKLTADELKAREDQPAEAEARKGKVVPINADVHPQ